jgi:hypothetical protein
MQGVRVRESFSTRSSKEIAHARAGTYQSSEVVWDRPKEISSIGSSEVDLNRQI